MEASTIATILLLGIPLLIGMIKVPHILFMVSFFSLIFGMMNLFLAGFQGGWYLFFSLLWVMFWICISFIPEQRKMWTTPLKDL